MNIEYDKDFEKVMNELQTNFGWSNIEILPDSYKDLLNDTIKAVKNCSIPDVMLSEERTELPEVGCMNSLGCACKEANGYPLTDCAYWQGN